MVLQNPMGPQLVQEKIPGRESGDDTSGSSCWCYAILYKLSGIKHLAAFGTCATSSYDPPQHTNVCIKLC